MHDTDEAHDHFDLAALGPEAVIEDVEGLEMFTLTSVGIDIGSSTSHLVFSRLTLRRQGAALSGRFTVTNREVLYRSPIMLTPYLSGALIDFVQVQHCIEAAYAEAGLTPAAIDTGAVIITGEALKKDNAQPIVEYFAKYSGKFICAAAGHNHEALLAAHGCGAVELAKRTGTTVLNVDIGGGTTKFALIEGGVVTQTAAINVGARLIAFDDAHVVTRLEEAGGILLHAAGHQVERGQKITRQQQADVATLMAEVLCDMIVQGPVSPLAQQLMVTPPLQHYPLSQVDHIVFSGGVAEYVYDHDRTAYGDVGPLLGQHVRARLQTLLHRQTVRQPTEGIRATVIGAGEYTVQASGTTSYISQPGVLPVFGLKVIPVSLTDGTAVVPAMQQALRKFDLPVFTSGLALSLALAGQLDYKSLRQVAEGIAAVLRHSDSPTSPLYLALDVDVAKSLGGILKEELELEREVIAVDGIAVGDLDYIDIGAPLGSTEVIPVTVKSLIFPGTRRG